MNDVVVLTGAGQIGMAIARRISYGKKLIIGDKNIENAKMISKTMVEAGLMLNTQNVIFPHVNQY